MAPIYGLPWRRNVEPGITNAHDCRLLRLTPLNDIINRLADEPPPWDKRPRAYTEPHVMHRSWYVFPYADKIDL